MLDTVARPLGTVVMPLGWKGGWRKVVVSGGPFDNAPGGHNQFSVAVRAERIKPGQAHVHLPIRDFSVPENGADVSEALIKTFKAALNGKDVYVGCMGGVGRTGLFLALMAKTAGIEEPVKWVRENYKIHAVETNAQAKYVNDFDVTGIRKAVLGYAWGRTLARMCFLPSPQ